MLSESKWCKVKSAGGSVGRCIMKWSNDELLLCVVIDVWLYVQHFDQWCVEEAVFIQNVSDHP